MGETITIDAEPFAPDAWGEFGWVPVPDSDPTDGIHSLEFSWEDAHLNYISHGPDEVERVDGMFVVNRLYHHDMHTQALMPSVRAFVLRPLDCIVLHRGTWHYGPFPLGDDPVQMLNLQGRRYEEDSAFVDLDDATGVRVTVRTNT